MAKVGPDKRNVVQLGEQQAKQPRGAAVRVKLLDAAEALLLEHDAHQLRLDDVLAGAGVARNTLYLGRARHQRRHAKTVRGMGPPAQPHSPHHWALQLADD